MDVLKYAFAFILLCGLAPVGLLIICFPVLAVLGPFAAIADFFVALAEWKEKTR